MVFHKRCAECQKPYWLDGGGDGVCCKCILKLDTSYYSAICRGIERHLGDRCFKHLIFMIVGNDHTAASRMEQESFKLFLLGPTESYCMWLGYSISPFRSHNLLHTTISWDQRPFESRCTVMDHILDFLEFSFKHGDVEF